MFFFFSVWKAEINPSSTIKTLAKYYFVGFNTRLQCVHNDPVLIISSDLGRKSEPAICSPVRSQKFLLLIFQPKAISWFVLEGYSFTTSCSFTSEVCCSLHWTISISLQDHQPTPCVCHTQNECKHNCLQGKTSPNVHVSSCTYDVHVMPFQAMKDGKVMKEFHLL